jgi:hypothetical protein
MGQITSRQKQSVVNETNTLSIYEKLLKTNKGNEDDKINYEELVNAIKKANKVEIKLYC